MKITRMHLRVVPLLIAIIMIFRNYDKVEGLSNKDDEELERQLKLLNKPAVKTIKTDYGDIYDCVDFYQQRAFDHPLLKNHTYHPQMKPTFSLTIRDEESSTLRTSSIRLRDGGCPMGTVPIRRTTKEDLIREKKYLNRFNASYATGIYHFALAQTKPGPQISAAGATVSIYNPKVQSNQWSASVVKVQKGRDQIQAGWRVDPILYGDNRTRFFVLFKAGTTQCFNTRCPGFVIVNTDVPLDHAFGGVSHPGLIVEDAFYIQKDLINGRWWLFYGREPATQVGFWLPEIFSELKDFATEASWGGEAFSFGTTFPPMGSGIFPKLDTTEDAYLSNVFIMNSAGETLDTGRFHFSADARDLYRADAIQTHTNAFGHLVVYGGPGSNN